MRELTRIVAAVVDTTQMTVYKADGSTVIIPQGDPRLRRIMEEQGEHLAMHGWADVDLSEPDDHTYVDFETKTNGVVRFFRIAKAKLQELLGAKEVVPNDGPIAPMTLGAVPTAAATVAGAPLPPASDPQDEHFDPVVSDNAPAKVVQSLAAVGEIIANATPVSSPKFNEEGIVKQRDVANDEGETENSHPEQHATDTIIAVVDNKVIPNMELIKSQFSRAVKLGSTEGATKFLQRLGTVIEQRSHSVEDLLKFMERGDLPIANDGSILIFKVLNYKLRDGERTTYKDCHTGNVEQFVGAYVCMDPKLVDHNRNNECSNGLHVARRGYIRQFSGNVCVLAKLAPEDVITVPAYDANKMRVCGYHILFELTVKQYQLLQSNRPITEDEDGKVLLGRAMAGDHIHKTHEVRIRGPKGGDVLTTELAHEPAPVLAPVEVKPAEALPTKQRETDKAVNLKDVNKVVEQAKSKREQAQDLYDAWCKAEGDTACDAAYQALIDFKKTAKKGWDVLGIPSKDGKPVRPKKKAERIVNNAPKQKTEAIRTPQALDKMAGDGSPRERIAKLLTLELTADIAVKIMAIKKAAKKSWDNLGVSDKDLKKILKLTGN